MYIHFGNAPIPHSEFLNTPLGGPPPLSKYLGSSLYNLQVRELNPGEAHVPEFHGLLGGEHKSRIAPTPDSKVNWSTHMCRSVGPL